MNETATKKVTDDEKEMAFLDHLEELRWRLIKAIVAVMICAIAVYFFSDKVLTVLINPYNEALSKLNKTDAQKLIFLAPTGGFMIHIKLAVFSGIFLSLPIIFYQLWQFIAPGLFESEKKYVPLVVVLSTLCFAVGALFCYFVVLRYGLRFLLSFETSDLIATISVNEYLQFITMLLLVFGLIFELPILAFFLTKVGFLTPAFMRYYRRHGIVTMVILAALITPPDIFTQLLLAGPLVLLYEISIVVSKFALKKSESQAE
ncbi:twin-arginine translocase subunit TatC [candidate division KSB1 bacterium]|nr:twin-arginine translocase subunit TatC [candidate division KSB1 bacterium]NIR68808.1 twin-arginine translocase subunit TatC [candidate division KSB1 bacterium]NIS27171.1 twin-arginine translocase subunit TatC [candidate division KSB1 bacterium]NIT74056.1 twin-arginine translocase subunit TatC [candidate division KSB1 bacterium]NIU26921.1 twin-arginine translocase subunit TatC [candidate division KSB1 bacterium]